MSFGPILWCTGLFGALRYRKSHNNQSVDAFEAFVGVQSLAHHVVAKALFRQQQRGEPPPATVTEADRVIGSAPTGEGSPSHVAVPPERQLITTVTAPAMGSPMFSPLPAARRGQASNPTASTPAPRTPAPAPCAPTATDRAAVPDSCVTPAPTQAGPPRLSLPPPRSSAAPDVLPRLGVLQRSLGWRQAVGTPCPVTNDQGFTCYLGAALTSFASSDVLLRAILASPSVPGDIIAAVQQVLLAHLAGDPTTSVSPRPVYDAMPALQDGRQRDIAEPLHFLLDALRCSVRGNVASSREMVSTITGEYVEQKICGRCRKPRGAATSMMLNPISFLAPARVRESATLQDSIEEHLQTLRAEDTNLVSDLCKGCGSGVCVTKVSKVVVPALLLCVVSRNSPHQLGAKLRGMVTVDGGTVVGDHRYEVLACGLHQGDTQHGHYVSCVRQGNQGDIVRFNDGNAPVSLGRGHSWDAILRSERRDGFDSTLVLLERVVPPPSVSEGHSARAHAHPQALPSLSDALIGSTSPGPYCRFR
jgi:hypothetical protein